MRGRFYCSNICLNNFKITLENNRFLKDIALNLRLCIGIKVNHSRKQIKKNDARCPNIELCTGNSVETLRRKIDKSTSLTQNGFRSRIKLYRLTEVKDTNQFWLWIKNNVLRLDIMVNNIKSMKVLKSIQYLVHNPSDFLFLDMTIVQKAV